MLPLYGLNFRVFRNDSIRLSLEIPRKNITNENLVMIARQFLFTMLFTGFIEFFFSFTRYFILLNMLQILVIFFFAIYEMFVFLL